MSDVYRTMEHQGYVAIITEITRVNRSPRVRKLSKDEYLDVKTGEIRQYEHRENRSQNRNSLLRTFATIRGLVNANSVYPERVKFLTLTYKENMTDPERLYRDFKNFWGRLMTWHKQKGLPKPEYLSVVEPQGRGAWHCHVLLFYPSKAPYIPFYKLLKLWGLGGCWITHIPDGMDNLGAYLTAYLADFPLEEIDQDLTGEESTKLIFGKQKKVIKGGRLPLYPPGMNIYRCSRGLLKPVKHCLGDQAAKKYREENEPTYTTEKHFKDPKTGFETSIYREYYNWKPGRQKGR